MSTEEDSADLTDQEVRSAVETVDFEQLAQLLSRALAPESPSVGECGRYSVARHEIRRRRPHLFLRSYLFRPGEPERVVLHRIDWVEEPSAREA